MVLTGKLLAETLIKYINHEISLSNLVTKEAISKATFPLALSFRLVRNLSARGFPTRFACVNDRL